MTQSLHLACAFVAFITDNIVYITGCVQPLL